MHVCHRRVRKPCSVGVERGCVRRAESSATCEDFPTRTCTKTSNDIEAKAGFPFPRTRAARGLACNANEGEQSARN